jgi:ribosomal protein L37AE/L43A
MPPEFNKKTIDTLAKRAAFKCSNPDWRVSTVGPNTDSYKSTIIGEAAHIFGARPNSKRYCPKMTDAARAEITNSIWLCRNCHKLIDTDEQKYTSDILFAWREQHERYIQSELGSATDQIQFEEQTSKLSLFENYPSLIRRIVIDKPDGWEFRLTAELMRHLNRPHFRKIKDLRDGLYVKPQVHIDSEEVINWLQMRLAEASNMSNPIANLIDRLNESWGPPGEPGNVEEIYHITCLIRDYLEQVVKYEEQIYFANAPKEYGRLIDLLKNLLGSQAEKLAEIPDYLDEVVSLIGAEYGDTIERPHVIKKTIYFDIPKEWNKQFNREFRRAKRHQSQETGKNGCLAFFIIAFIIWLVMFIF